MRDVDAILATVRPELEALEGMRLQLRVDSARAWKTIGITVGSIVVAAWVIAMIAGRGEPFAPLLIAGLVVAVVAGIVLYAVRIGSPAGKLKRTYKERAVGSIVQAMEPGMTFTPRQGVSEPDFVRSRLFSTTPDRYRCEDGLQGTIGKTAVQISEVKAEERRTSTDSKGNTRTHYVTIFDGVFMIADFHKEFRNPVRVLPDTAERLFGGLGKMLQGFTPFSSEDLVYLEDPEFEKEFVVYGKDQVEARYLLSTAFLRRLLDLKRNWNSAVRLSLIDNLVFLAIPHSRDLLEPNLSGSALSRDLVARIVTELSVCFDLVEDLNLNTRIWSKS